MQLVSESVANAQLSALHDLKTQNNYCAVNPRRSGPACARASDAQLGGLRV